MTLNVVRILCERLSLSKLYDDFVFIWHGGEPMIMGVEFYESVIHIQSTILRKKFVNTFQSNCTLINDTWISFLKKYDIKVSTSIDGDEELHNINRIRGNKGTFAEVIRNVKRLQEENLLAGVVTVLSRQNIDKIDRILNYFSSAKISTRLNPILPCERVEGQPDLSIEPIEYADALIKCFDHWVDGQYPEGEKIMIAPLTDIIYNMTHDSKPRLCNFSGTCGDSFIAINHNGDLYNCGRFCEIDDYKIANIQEINSIDEIIEKKKMLIRWHINDDKADECANCEWFKICNRGCPNTSYLYYGKVANKDPYCEAYKKLFSHIYSRITSEFYEIRN